MKRIGLRFSSRVLAVAAILLFTGGAPRAHQKNEGESDFWGNLAQPGHKKFLAALNRGRGFYDNALKLVDSQLRRRALSDALAAFQEANRANPTKAEGFFWIGKALYELDRLKEAISAFNKARRLNPDYDNDYSMAFTLGIAHSKMGAFETAVLEYDQAERTLAAQGLGITDAQNVRATLHGNVAESLMALGRLEEAIQRYRASVALQPGYALAWWGLAIALDRDEQISKAREAVTRALAGDPDMRALTSEGVFFIPAGDIHYYFAFGYWAKGDLVRSKKEWESFLAALPRSQWAYRAQAHLAQLGGGGAPASKPRRKHLAPSPVLGGIESDVTEQDQAAIRYRIQGHLHDVRQCYQKELRQNATLSGQLRLELIVSKEGRIQEVRIISSTIRRPPLHLCVLAAIRRISFNRPAAGKSVKLIYPIEFKPGP